MGRANKAVPSSSEQQDHCVPDSHAFAMTALFDLGSSFINTVGGLLLLAGTGVALFETARLFIANLSGAKYKLLVPTTGGHRLPLTMDSIRLQIGTLISFSLQLMVSADVIDTIAQPLSQYTIEMLHKIAIAVLIRTVLDYFLGKECEVIMDRTPAD